MPAKPAKTTARPRAAGQPPSAPPLGIHRRRDGQSSLKPALPAPFSAPTRTLRPGRDAAFADLGVPEPWSPRSARVASRAVPDPGRDHPGCARGQGRAGPWPYGLGQDPGLRPAHDQQTRRVVRPSEGAPRGLVLVPTRELAMQVADVIAPLARIAGLSLVLVAGGMPYPPQILAFSRGVDIVVATPGG